MKNLVWLAEKNCVSIYESSLQSELLHFSLNEEDQLIDCLIAERVGLLVTLSVSNLEIFDLFKDGSCSKIPFLSAKGLCLSSDQSFCVCFGEKSRQFGFIAVVNLSGPRVLLNEVKCKAPVNTVMISACGTKLVALCQDNCIRIYDIFSLEQTGETQLGFVPERATIFGPGHLWAVAGAGAVSILDAQTGSTLYSDDDLCSQVTALASSNSRKLIAIGRSNGTIRLLNSEAWSEKITLTIQDLQREPPAGPGIVFFHGIAAISWDFTGRIAASASDGRIYFWSKDFSMENQFIDSLSGSISCSTTEMKILCRNYNVASIFNTDNFLLSAARECPTAIIKLGWIAADLNLSTV